MAQVDHIFTDSPFQHKVVLHLFLQDDHYQQKAAAGHDTSLIMSVSPVETYDSAVYSKKVIKLIADRIKDHLSDLLPTG